MYFLFLKTISPVFLVLVNYLFQFSFSKKFFYDVFRHPCLQAGTNRENGHWVMGKDLKTLLAAGRNDITL